MCKYDIIHKPEVHTVSNNASGEATATGNMHKNLVKVGGVVPDKHTVRLINTRCYFNLRSKADMSRLNLQHRNDN